MEEKLRVYIGTFSDRFFSALIDPESLDVEELRPIRDPAGRSASLALSENRRFLYAANEYMNGDGGMAAFRLSEDGGAVFLNAIPSHTQGPAENAVMTAYGREYVIGSGFFDGDIMVCPIAENGSLLPMSDNFVLREGAHAHGVKVCPGTNFVILPDTLHGEIYTYEMSPEGKLIKRFAFRKEGVEAPRHMEFSPDGRQLYVLTEKTSTLEVLRIDRETGELTHTLQISNLPGDFKGESSSAAIHRSPDGRFVYLSNRGYDSITVYRVDDDGTVQKVGCQPASIRCPREFMISPDGSLMLVGNQTDESVSIFRMNRETGMPEFAKKFPIPEGPVSFVSIPQAGK